MIKGKILIVEDQFVEAEYLRIMLTKASYMVTGIARSVTQARESLQTGKPDFVLLDIFLKGSLSGIDLAKQLVAENIPFIYLSANSNEEILNKAKETQPYGFLVKPFREKDLLVTLEIARYRHEHSEGKRRKNETELKAQLRKVLIAPVAWIEKIHSLATVLQKVIPFDYFDLSCQNPGPETVSETGILRTAYDEYQAIGLTEIKNISHKSENELAALRSEVIPGKTAGFYNDSDFIDLRKSLPATNLLAESFGLRSHLILPVTAGDGNYLCFRFYSKRPNSYTAENLSMQYVMQDLVSGIEKDAFDTNAGPFSRGLSYRKKVMTAAGSASDVFQGIIGKSHLLLSVFDEISQVAGSNTSVLILGESGTGKERVADCIHRLSTRNNMPLVKVNCATLPVSLIESELFGHERGSFTGASEKRIGKFEKANKGTIFLDEIGEMSLEMQVKLLRVLQEREIEPIGSNKTIKVDLRVIAATNKNLEKEVAEGRFRLDLYYRLNVFPITLPTLRERKDDIEILTNYFINHFNQKTGKKVTGISASALKEMMSYPWPGNIRELEHLIERQVLMAKKSVIEEISLPKFTTTKVPEPGSIPVKTIHENERDYILLVLKQCKGRIWGKGAAAELLNIPPSTLKSRMKKLQISKEYLTN